MKEGAALPIRACSRQRESILPSACLDLETLPINVVENDSCGVWVQA
jgi:hypothetical protein